MHRCIFCTTHISSRYTYIYFAYMNSFCWQICGFSIRRWQALWSKPPFFSSGSPSPSPSAVPFCQGSRVLCIDTLMGSLQLVKMGSSSMEAVKGCTPQPPMQQQAAFQMVDLILGGWLSANRFVPNQFNLQVWIDTYHHRRFTSRIQCSA